MLGSILSSYVKLNASSLSFASFLLFPRNVIRRENVGPNLRVNHIGNLLRDPDVAMVDLRVSEFVVQGQSDV